MHARFLDYFINAHIKIYEHIRTAGLGPVRLKFTWPRYRTVYLWRVNTEPSGLIIYGRQRIVTFQMCIHTGRSRRRMNLKIFNVISTVHHSFAILCSQAVMTQPEITSSVQTIFWTYTQPVRFSWAVLLYRSLIPTSMFKAVQTITSPHCRIRTAAESQ